MHFKSALPKRTFSDFDGSDFQPGGLEILQKGEEQVIEFIRAFQVDHVRYA